MADIYRNSFLVIAAAKSSTAQGGPFCSLAKSCWTFFQIRDFRRAFLRLYITAHTGRILGTKRFRWFIEPGRSRNGSSLQGSSISPFEELIMECGSKYSCECQETPDSINQASLPKVKATFIKPQSQSAERYGLGLLHPCYIWNCEDDPEHHRRDVPCRFVAEYTSRESLLASESRT